MEPIHHGELQNHISSVSVTFSDTGETVTLSTKKNSTCHFFEPFVVENDNVQLRLHWAELDFNGHPTLDADFINRKTRRHRSLKGIRKAAHHTTSSSKEVRSYEWSFKGAVREFCVAVTWCSSATERACLGAFCTAEVISTTDRK